MFWGDMKEKLVRIYDVKGLCIRSLGRFLAMAKPPPISRDMEVLFQGGQNKCSLTIMGAFKNTNLGNKS